MDGGSGTTPRGVQRGHFSSRCGAARAERPPAPAPAPLAPMAAPASAAPALPSCPPRARGRGPAPPGQVVCRALAPGACMCGA